MRGAKTSNPREFYGRRSGRPLVAAPALLRAAPKRVVDAADAGRRVRIRLTPRADCCWVRVSTQRSRRARVFAGCEEGLRL